MKATIRRKEEVEAEGLGEGLRSQLERRYWLKNGQNRKGELGDIEVQTQMVAKIDAGQGEPGMVAYISSVSS